MPYRNPVATAKMMATLDQMSEGRVIAGVGAVGMRPSLRRWACPSMSAAPAQLNTSACGRPVAPDPVTFQGQFFSFADMYHQPLQQPHPPIWIGGASCAALRRRSVRAGLATNSDVGGSVASGANLSA